MSLAKDSALFLDFIEDWLANLPVLTFGELIPQPESSAIISADVINGFLYDGPLSSPRVAAIDEPITQLLKVAWKAGLRDVLLVQEGHREDALEFDAFGAHAVKGTPEAETIDMIKALPFFSQMDIIFKESIHPALNNNFDEWIEQRNHLNTFIAVGDVTDLCLYHLATYLRFHANAYHQARRVIVPTNCVQTWHISVKDAEDLPVIPHHGDLLHAVFLYHMALNGIEVVREILP